MQGSQTRTGRLEVVTGYTIALALCLGILTWQLKLWRVDLSVPLAYKYDGLFTAMWIKGLLENGWYLHNDRLGMPTGSDLHDFPMPDNLHFLALKLLGYVCRDYALTYNLYFLLTFPLTTWTSLHVLRRFGIGWAPAIVVSLLFTFLPYHLFRGPHHIFLAAYYLIPPIVMVVLWVYLDQIPWFGSPGMATAPGEKPYRGRLIESLFLCALVASAGIYYAFFACFFLLVAGLASGLRRRSVHPLLLACTLAGSIGGGVLVNLAPTLLYQREHGPNAEAVVRDPAYAEHEGLKVAQLVLPVFEHRARPLADLRDRYRNQAPLISENDWSPIGLTATVGFVLLLGRLFYRSPQAVAPCVVDGLAVLTIGAVLLATVGGFGSVFAFVVSPMIRCYSRISVYIGFFALFLVAIGLDMLGRRCLHGLSQVVFHVCIGLLLIAGIWDQASRYFKRIYVSPTQEYLHDAEFVRAIEAAVPPESMVFQLPYTPFPEGGLVHQMQEYDHLRPYLHSRNLRWSYGATKGRTGDFWQRTVANYSEEEMVHALIRAGFSGIYLDRAGYADYGRETETELAKLLAVQPLTSRNGRMLFFDLTDYSRRVRSRHSDKASEAERQRLHNEQPLVCTWCNGFHVLEKQRTDEWRWCSSCGELHITNPSSRDKHVTLSMSIRSLHAAPVPLSIESPLFSAEVQVSARDLHLERTVTIPPGLHVIHFRCSGDAVRVAGDPRELVFMVKSFRATETRPIKNPAAPLPAEQAVQRPAHSPDGQQ